MDHDGTIKLPGAILADTVRLPWRELRRKVTLAVRDSKNPAGPMLTFTATEWCAFTAGVCAGEFD